MKNQQEFLVVIEDTWYNKDSVRVPLGQIGTQIQKFCLDYDVKPENDDFDYEKYNSDDPYDVGTFGFGFYDISLVDKNDLDEYGGRIMIFQL
jgi:predicted transport protein